MNVRLILKFEFIAYCLSSFFGGGGGGGGVMGDTDIIVWMEIRLFR